MTSTVIITRPVPAIEDCAAVFQAAGLEVFKAPCFDIQTNHSVRREWLQSAAEVWLVLSTHALHHAAEIWPDLTPPANTRVLAVGAAVANAWQQHHGQAIEYHPDMNSEGVIELLSKYQPKSVKILTTGDSRELIRSYCRANQISYSQINTYQRIPMPLDQAELLKLYQTAAVVLTATSCGILKQMMSQLSAELQAKMLSQPLVVGAKRIAELGKELGFVEVHLAASPSDQAMCEAVMAVGLNL